MYYIDDARCFVTFFNTNIERLLSSIFLSGNIFMNDNENDWALCDGHASILNSLTKQLLTWWSVKISFTFLICKNSSLQFFFWRTKCKWRTVAQMGCSTRFSEHPWIVASFVRKLSSQDLTKLPLTLWNVIPQKNFKRSQMTSSITWLLPMSTQ